MRTHRSLFVASCSLDCVTRGPAPPGGPSHILNKAHGARVRIFFEPSYPQVPRASKGLQRGRFMTGGPGSGLDIGIIVPLGQVAMSNLDVALHSTSASVDHVASLPPQQAAQPFRYLDLSSKAFFRQRFWLGVTVFCTAGGRPR